MLCEKIKWQEKKKKAIARPEIDGRETTPKIALSQSKIGKSPGQGIITLIRGKEGSGSQKKRERGLLLQEL